jgi:hypothetical protein
MHDLTDFMLAKALPRAGVRLNSSMPARARAETITTGTIHSAITAVNQTQVHMTLLTRNDRGIKILK